jgi:hypothetical protein
MILMTKKSDLLAVLRIRIKKMRMRIQEQISMRMQMLIRMQMRIHAPTELWLASNSIRIFKGTVQRDFTSVFDIYR